jgi:short-subunit dehydrogenase
MDDRKRPEDRTVLITGASAGIGRELARVFAANGHDLILASRNQAKLDALAAELEDTHEVRTLVVPVDLTESDAPSRLFGEIRRRGIAVDILVNNAGVGHFQNYPEGSLVQDVEVVRLNVLSLTAMTRLFVPGMIERGHGRVLNVGSVAGFQPAPRMAVYGATKAFVLSLTEALATELEGTGVTVTVLCPGFTDTELVEHIAAEAGDPALVPPVFMLDPVEVAREGYQACMEGSVVHVNGLTYQVALMIQSWQPRWVMRWMGKAVSDWLAGH